MAESKFPIDTVIKQLSDTLNQHDNTIRRFESSIESIQSQIRVRFNTVRTENQDEIRSLQTNLTPLIESKDALWTQLSGNMLSINNDLRKLKIFLAPQPTTPSPLLEQTPSDHRTINAHPNHLLHFFRSFLLLLWHHTQFYNQTLLLPRSCYHPQHQSPPFQGNLQNTLVNLFYVLNNIPVRLTIGLVTISYVVFLNS